MWCNYDGARLKTIYNKMSNSDRAEAASLGERIPQIVQEEKKISGRLADMMARYSSVRNSDKIVQDWADMAVIAGAIIATNKDIRNFVVKKGVEKGTDELKKNAILITMGEEAEKIIDILTSSPIVVGGITIVSGPAVAALKAYKPQNLGTGDDMPNEINAANAQLSDLQEELINSMSRLSFLIDKYDTNILCITSRTVGPSLMAGPL